MPDAPTRPDLFPDAPPPDPARRIRAATVKLRALRTQLGHDGLTPQGARTLIDDRNQQALLSTVLQIWSEVGIDVGELLASVEREREELIGQMESKRRLGPVQGFVIPTLRRCGLLSERVAAHFHDFLRANLGSQLVGDDVEEFLERIPDLPHDTAAWVMGANQ